MSSYTVTKKKKTDSAQFQVTVIVISFLSSFIIPFIILYPIQEILFKPDNVWFFEAPLSTYFTFILGILFLSIVLLINLVVEARDKRKKQLKLSMLAASFVVGIVVITLCLFNYQYMNMKGIYQNHYFSFSETFTSWDDITAAKQTYIKKDKVTKDDKFIFTLKDGSTLELEMTAKMRKSKVLIRQRLLSNGVKLESVYPE